MINKATNLLVGKKKHYVSAFITVQQN